jgi:hypothetical protein
MLQCPSCQAILTFSSEKSNVLECSCGKVIRLNDAGFASTTELLPAAHSADFIVPGTRGKWQDKTFSVTGRFVTRGKGWLFNYWNIIFDDGEVCYLAEGYGSYAILKPAEGLSTLSSTQINFLKLNNSTNLRTDEAYYLIRKNVDVDINIEAEVFLPETSRDINVLDFYSEKGNYITVIEFLRNVIRYYDTIFTDFAELQLRNVKPAGKTKTMACLHCYKTLHLKANPFTFTITCLHCGTHHLFNQVNDSLTNIGRNKLDAVPDIEIGSTGTVDGITFEVIGYSFKEENNADTAQWKEYVLYNRSEGFAFLSEFEGNWIYVKEMAKPPVVGDLNRQYFNYDGKQYDLYNAYTYEVLSAVGEHPYDITKTANYKVREYIAPPYGWTSETNNNESNWFLGRHVSHREILNNFSFPSYKPAKQGIGMVQPTGMLDKGKFIKIILIALFVLIAIHMGTAISKQEKILLEDNFSFDDTANKLTIVTPKFTLDKWKSNLLFNIGADVSNNWFQLSGSLINAQTGKAYSFEKGVEFYSGYSGGESWTEGSKTEEAYLSAIPAGTYFLNLTGSREAGGFNRLQRFSLKVVYDVRTDRNLWFAILLLAIVAVIQYLIYSYNNKKRWQNSRYSPYNYEH